MKKNLLLFAAAVSTALLLTSNARAGLYTELGFPQVQPSAVVPGDTFSFDVSGFNSAGTTGYLLFPAQTVAFGTTMTYTGIGPNGQNITITSSEVINGTTTTDTFTVSTPTNFLTTTTVNGTTITSLQFDLGNANSGSNNVAVLPAINTASATGNLLYGANNTSFTLAPAVTLGTGNLSYAAVEGIGNGTTAISGVAVHQFTINVTYTNVPEPSTLALGALGLIGGMAGIVRRRARAAK